MERTLARRAAGARLRRLGLTGLALLSIAAAATDAQASVADAVERCFPAVVHVSVRFEPARSTRRAVADAADFVAVERPGSGVVVSADGLIATNAHLVAEIADGEGDERDEYWLVVVDHLGGEFPARVVARDERTDLALLQVVGDGFSDVTALPFAGRDDVAVGARVVALARPDGVERFAFAGGLAFAGGPVRLREALLTRDEVVLTDARVHDMLDGGPVVDALGRVVALHNSSHIRPEAPGFHADPDSDEDVVSTDYAVTVAGATIRETFGRWLEPHADPVAPLAGAPSTSASTAVARIAPSLVSVWTGADDERPGSADPADPHARLVAETLGSGVVVDASGLVLTSDDLFAKDDDDATVRLASGATYPATRIARRRAKGVALLSVRLPEGVELPVAVLADPRAVGAGDDVVITGRPFADMLTLSVGVLSNVERRDLFQVASWIHGGHFGGAVVDGEGRLVAVAVRQPVGSGGATEESYLGFAAPLTSIVKWFDDEWDAPALSPGDEPPPRVTNAVARVVDGTQASLINVLVSEAIVEEPRGFDPFGGGEETERRYRPLGQGSGVIIDASGLALSNWHVVDAALAPGGGESPDHRVTVSLPDGRDFVARVLSTSRDDDLALLRLELDGEVVEPVELGDSDAIPVGAPVVAIGNPLGLSDSVSAGIIAAKDQDVHIRGRLRAYEGMLMTDAAINPGNSGGALLDLEGRLVGINSAGRVGAGMAIPVNRARDVFSGKLLSAERMRSAYLGLEIEESDEGVVVDWVDPVGPAARAKIETGDRIVRVGSAEVRSAVEFAEARLAAAPATPLAIAFVRADAEHAVEVVPLGFATWRLVRQCGIEVAPVDYRAETELVRNASIALHRAYTGNPDAIPVELMTGALRVVRAYSLDPEQDLDVKRGDLLLGMLTVIEGPVSDQHSLTRFETVEDVAASFDPLATKDGETRECWLLREGEIRTVDVTIRRPPR